MHFNAQLKVFLDRGWIQFPQDDELSAWVASAIPYARKTIADPENAQWYRCDGTWFVGANTLANDEVGAVAASGPLTGPGCDFVRQLELGDYTWDRGQISVMYPGYPQQGRGESDAAHQFRLRHDSAHVDGLHPVGDSRKRYLYEHHGFVLGIPLVDFDADASPLVVWEGSHHLVQSMFREQLARIAPGDWRKRDLTDCYHRTRRQVLNSCTRNVVHCRPGESYLLHRHVVHGVAPWAPGAQARPDGRMICYFRPELADKGAWLNAP